MDHDGLVRLSILTDIAELKPFRIVEVHLNGRALPGSAKGVLDLNVDFWSVEGAAPLIQMEGDPPALERPLQRICREDPLVIRAD